MRRYLTFVGLWLVTALVLLSCSEPAVQLPPLGEDDVVLAFGDSLTRGTGAPRGQGYPEVLARLSGRQVVNAGIPGEMSDAGRARLAGVLDQVQPALLILCHGGNDMLRKRSLERLRENLAAMIDMARSRGINVVLLGVPRPGIFLNPADLYEELARSTATPIEADAITEVLSDARLKADPAHPNAAGYRELAEKVYARLERAGAL